jgi:hypothetical protein
MGHVEAVLILIKNQENWLCYTFIIKKSTHYIYLIFFYIVYALRLSFLYQIYNFNSV